MRHVFVDWTRHAAGGTFEAHLLVDERAGLAVGDIVIATDHELLLPAEVLELTEHGAVLRLVEHRSVDVTAVRVIERCTVEVAFSDGAVRVRDLTSLLVGPVFAPLHDLAVFATVAVDPALGVLEWPDHDPTVDAELLRYDDLWTQTGQ